MPSVRNLTIDTPWQEIRTTKADWRKADAGMLGHMLHHLHLVRAFEETVLELVGEDLVHGPAHSSIGQEGAAVGCLSALRSSDQINGTHRAHHHFLAKALPHVLPDDFDPLRDDMPEAMQDVMQRTLAEIM
ncbi:MAG: MFS transporter, partial [Alphaproteobacteria bacterium]|nr:MFS transporter [Alphaproteobacteria bacterium]